MADSRHTPPSRKVSLEQLIQLKRTERPERAFWDDFDREFHRRQLAALVTVEPWHRRVGRVLAGITRRLAPAGAGATAIAVALLALVRVDPQHRASQDKAAAVAANESDTRVVVLPEEAISVSAISAPMARARIAPEEFSGNIRSAPQELGTGLASARRFVAVAAPVTVSSESDTSAIYSARALTAGTVLRSIASAAPESL